MSVSHGLLIHFLQPRILKEGSATTLGAAHYNTCSAHPLILSNGPRIKKKVKASNQDEVSDFKRPFCTNFNPDIWGNSFIQYASESMKVEDETELQKVQQLQEEVKKMFVSLNNHNLPQKLNFIDSVQRLGVSYHFEREIEEALAHIHNICTNNNIIITQDEDLHTLALLFRLLRQEGYPISSDVFNKFKNDNNGNFDERIAKDVQGMLALYEAAELRVHGEDMLDEALHFTCTHLKNYLTNNQLSPSLAAQVNHRLSQPLHKRLPRIEARHYMSFYQQDPSHSHTLLTFAKIDYNMLQKLHQKEIGSLTKWWKKLESTTKVPHARERFVESYFWTLAMSFEPQYSTPRTLVGKFDAVLCLVDDTYDAYATAEELELFTEAIHRWDKSLIKSLPECMKAVFEAVVGVYSEMELVAAEKGTSFMLPRFKRGIYDLLHAYLVEAKWRDEGYIPTYDEYKDNGAVSSAYTLQQTLFCGLGKFATKEVLDFISLDSKIIRAASLVARLVDDIASHKLEQERNHVVSAVECCMKQYGISSEEAYKIIYNDVLNYWKDINEGCLKPHAVPKPVLDIFVNLARVVEVVYENFKDSFTNAELLRHHVNALLVDPIAIEYEDK